MKARTILFALILLNFAFTWPWEAQKNVQAPKSPQSSKAQTEQQKTTPAMSTQEEITEEIVWEKRIVRDDDGEKGSEDEEGEEIEAVQLAVPLAQPVAKPIAKPVTVSPVSFPGVVQVVKPPVQQIQTPIQQLAAPVASSQVISDVQRQVNEIVALNQSLELQQLNQLAEVRRIIDQAKIHQRILNELQESPGAEKPRKVSAEELIKQEKIRLILTETSRNKETIKKIEEEYKKEIEKSDQQSQAESKSKE